MKDSLATEHAELRLLQRAHDSDTTITELWEEAIPCEVRYHGYDEARVSPEHDLVLLMEDEQIVTCLNGTYNVTVEGKDMETYLADSMDNHPKDLSGRSTNENTQRSDENNANNSEDQD